MRILALSIGDEGSHRLWESVLPPPGYATFADAGVQIEHLALPLSRRALLTPLVAQLVPGLRRYAFGRARSVNMELYARAVAPLISRQATGSDVLHMWGAGLLAAATSRAARQLGVPFVTTPFAHRGQWADDPSSARVYREADCVFALLEADAKLYRELGARTVAVCGVCSDGVTPGLGNDLRRRHDIAGRLVLFLGRRQPYKGFELLLEAAHGVPDVTFAFVGPGPAAAAPHPGRVIDAGVVDDTERAAWLDAADILCLPSEAEIFPSSMLEAWSVGTPALVSEIEPLLELVQTTGGGVAVPRDVDSISSAIRDLCAEPARARALGAAGNDAWQRRFTPKQVASAYERVYRELVPAERIAA